VPRTAKSQISFADWELLRQGISLEPFLQWRLFEVVTPHTMKSPRIWKSSIKMFAPDLRETVVTLFTVESSPKILYLLGNIQAFFACALTFVRRFWQPLKSLPLPGS